ncbi:hypothetical protein GGR50DRAFT_703809 [Xylaria sp. CBS 124048]|nr:hypothetical protein GGR50DRAFT_703809 [Xylaria sp. CBS 124048]
MFIGASSGFSTPQGQRKITRRLYTKLKHFQADDMPIPNPTLLEIKFYLRTNRRCCQIIVKGNDAIYLPCPIVLREYIPRFIDSQLESQRIADEHTQSIQLSTILWHLLRYLVGDPITVISVPTLFLWHDTERRRTFCLFAYLSCEMESRTYTVNELLSLRRSQVSETSHGLSAKLKEDPELDDVLLKSNGTQPQARAPRKPKKITSSSNESDEATYRGKINPRQTIQPGLNMQWRYSGRTGSEVTSSEPLSAPAGLDKQSSEGFQKFFKAVVSPTHVRVTAGGRIVPNTRGSASPTTKWDKERAPINTQHLVEPGKETKFESSYAPANNQPSAPMVPAAYPNPSMIYQHMGMPVAVYPPVQNAMQPGMAYQYGLATPHVSNMSYIPSPGVAQGVEGVAVHHEQRGGENHINTGRPLIRLSPPEQFDHNRPYYIDGQLVVPYAGMVHGQVAPMMANQYVPPVTMAGQGYQGQRMAGMNQANHMPMVTNYMPMATNHLPMVANNMPIADSHPRMAANNLSMIPSQMPMIGSNGHVSSNMVRPHPEATPGVSTETTHPKSSILLSEVTKKQIEGLKEALKFYESQLQYNRHQIDENQALSTIQKLQTNIDHFERIRFDQLRKESMHYSDAEPIANQNVGVMMSANTPSGPSSVRHAQASSSSRQSSVRSMAPARDSKQFQPQQAGPGTLGGHGPSRNALGLNSNRIDDSKNYMDSLEIAVIKKLAGPDATPDQKVMLESILKPFNREYDPKPSVDPNATHESCQRALKQAVRDGLTSPYLVGAYPPGVDTSHYDGHDFTYKRALNGAEEQARRMYWGRAANTGRGLPRFDGKDFYPPSPQKATERVGEISNPPQGRPDIDRGFDSRRSAADPFRSSRDGDSIRSYGSGRKFSKAIPIVAPPEIEKKQVPNASTTSEDKVNEGAGEISKLNESLQGMELSPVHGASAKRLEKKSSPLNRRALERSSAKSGHDLWQTMLKKGSTSGNVLPGALSSATATGYLPQFAGNAIASLGPTISNGSPARGPLDVDDKHVGLEGPRLAMEKVGENCPPGSAAPMERDVVKDLQKRMIRDAERRGAIGSDWQ